MARGLDSVRVLEIAGGRAGAIAGRLLGDLGATVARLSPDASRTPEPTETNASEAADRARLDAGKRLVRAGHDAPPDAPDDPDAATLERWLDWADVCIESAAPGPLRPRPEAAGRPRLVRVLVSPFGGTGPLDGLRSDDFTDEAFAGHLLLNGEPDREPIARPGRLSSYAAAVHAVIGVLAALRVRDRTGSGQGVEVSHLESLVALHQHTLTMWTHDGHVLRRAGNRQPGYWHPAGVLPCRDGHVVVNVVGQAARDRLLCAAGLPEAVLDPRFGDDLAVARHKDAFDALLAPWLRAHTASGIVASLQAARVAAAAVEPASRVLEDAHLAARGALVRVGDVRVPGAPFTIRAVDADAAPGPGTGARTAREAGDAPGRRPAARSGARPLAGLRVLDLGRVWAGPLAGRMLADLGADVVFVEAPDARGGRRTPPGLGAVTHLFPDGDPGERPWNRIGSVNALGRNKRGITLDLRRAPARRVLEALVAQTDVVLENLGPGVLDSFGLGFERLRALCPDVVLTSIDGFGPGGPDAGHVAFGPVVEARAGVTHAMGYRDGGPYRSGIAWPDPVAALHAVAATLAALHARDAEPHPRARHVAVSMLESALAAVPEPLLETQLGGGDPPRRGARHATRAPRGIYPCQGDDRWIAISVADDDAWHALCTELELPPALAGLDVAARRARHDEIDAAIADRTREADRMRLVHRLQASGVLAAWLADARDLVECAHLASRGFWREVDHPDAGTRREPGLPIRFDATPCTDARPAPRLGEHGRAVLAEWLGLDAAALDALEARGVLVDAPPESGPGR